MKVMRPTVVAGTLLCCVPLLAAQSAPADTRAPEDVDPSVVVLSEFRVDSTTDRGYVATQAAGATRTKTPLIELAHTVNVLNEQFLADTGAVKLYDALRYVSNVTGGDVRNDGDFGIGALGVRGFAVNRMRDGMNVTSAAALVDLNGYERVEMIKGASAVQLGSSNPGGLINYVPKSPLFSRKTTISGEVDSEGHLAGSLDHTGPLHAAGDFRSAYRLVLSAQDSESWMDYHNRKQWLAQLGVTARLSRDTSLTIRFETQQERTRESVGAPYAYYVNSTLTPTPVLLNLPIGFYRGELGDRKKAHTHIVDVTADTRLSADWSINFKAYGARAATDRIETFILNPGPTTPTNAWVRQTQQIPSITRALAAEINLLGGFEIGATRHRLLAGMTTLGNKGSGTNQRWERGTIDPLNPVYGVEPLGTRIVNLSNSSTNTYYGVYLDDQVKLLDERLILNAGARWDYSNNTGLNRITNATSATNFEKWSPRYSILYRITPEVSAYASYNESFQPAPAGTDIRGNRFQPLQGKQYEGGAKFNLLDGKVSGNVAVYEIRQENSITPDPSAPGFGIQGGETSSTGYEADIAWSPVANVQLIAAYGNNKFERNAALEATAPAGTQPPLWQSKAALWAKYTFASGSWKGLGLGLGVVNESRRHPSFDRRFTVPGYTVVNALVSYDWGRYSAALNVENLGDDRYVARIEEARMASFGAPLTFKLTVTGRF